MDLSGIGSAFVDTVEDFIEGVGDRYAGQSDVQTVKNEIALTQIQLAKSEEQRKIKREEQTQQIIKIAAFVLLGLIAGWAGVKIYKELK